MRVDIDVEAVRSRIWRVVRFTVMEIGSSKFEFLELLKSEFPKRLDPACCEARGPAWFGLRGVGIPGTVDHLRRHFWPGILTTFQSK